jgi:hypothetical protein
MDAAFGEGAEQVAGAFTPDDRALGARAQVGPKLLRFVVGHHNRATIRDVVPLVPDPAGLAASHALCCRPKRHRA